MRVGIRKASVCCGIVLYPYSILLFIDQYRLRQSRARPLRSKSRRAIEKRKARRVRSGNSRRCQSDKPRKLPEQGGKEGHGMLASCLRSKFSAQTEIPG